MKKRALLCLTAMILVLVSLTSCGKIKGTFALKYPMDDVYRIAPQNFEIRNTGKVDWIFKLTGVPSKKKMIGCFLMKKELVWVDVKSSEEEVGPGRGIVYGTIKNLEQGEYKIILTDIEKNRIVDTLLFTVYSEDR